jgi:WD40 repeat protein
VSIWDYDAGSLLAAVYGTEAAILGIVVIPSRPQLALVSTKHLRFWKFDEAERALSSSRPSSKEGLSADAAFTCGTATLGGLVVLGTSDGLFKIWNGADPVGEVVAHSRAIRALCSTTEAIFASADDGRVSVWTPHVRPMRSISLSNLNVAMPASDATVLHRLPDLIGDAVAVSVVCSPTGGLVCVLSSMHVLELPRGVDMAATTRILIPGGRVTGNAGLAVGLARLEATCRVWAYAARAQDGADDGWRSMVSIMLPNSSASLVAKRVVDDLVIASLAFSNDGSVLVAGASGGRVLTWAFDVASGQLSELHVIARTALSASVCELALTMAHVAAGDSTGRVCILKLPFPSTNGQLEGEGQTNLWGQAGQR